MLSGLEIKNFKGIKSGTISDLAQVNVLVGRNNSGKSTILDALLLLRCAFSSMDYLGTDGLDQMLSRRVYRSEPQYRELRYMLSVEDSVVLTARFPNGGEVSQEWQPEQREAMVTATAAEIGPSVPKLVRPASHWPMEQAGRHLTQVWKESGDISLENITFVHFTHLIDTTTLRVPYLETVWEKVVLGRRDRVLREIIKYIYKLDIEGFSLMPFAGQNRLVALLPERSVAVNWLGDGLRYALNILALGMLLEGTVLMVEELETHQHPESLKLLTQTLFELAKKQNLQLFLTTHSWELMTYALEAAEQTGIGLAMHHLSLDIEGELHARAISEPDAKLLMDIGHDPRRIYKYIGVE